MFETRSGLEKKLLIRGRESRFSVSFFVSQSARSRRGDLCDSKLFCYGNNFWTGKRRKGEGGGVSRSPVGNFLSPSSKKVFEERFSVSKKSRYEKIHA